MMLVSRILAQLIDLLMGVLSFVVTFAYVLPFLSHYIDSNVFLGVTGLILIVLINFGVQYPFMKNQQTLGKGFFSLKIVSTEPTREAVTVAVIVQRELMCKLISCFFICIPVLFGKLGGHEEATRTKVVKVEKSIRRKDS